MKKPKLIYLTKENLYRYMSIVSEMKYFIESYDCYIQDNLDNMDGYWFPVSVDEFYNNEYQIEKENKYV